ncbi:CapA family protein [Flavobacterium glaciei]|uniref:Poly-gamma-glutamate synthesis protein (Capsule biosynthesis protein) n=1 Tax=Flavobacterium glaciei TaxID=386300 RepID=A0A562Q5W8_9FLAO|nr:CapA family protein [Flavobacterium glaciei]RDI58370.1 poly-gamma-glutamate synthesis protein (capsule biosynthesis protein) [Flavobacterium glaciei]TWI52155.1 poly-gamma-glutamate synthesis protein (capsule biosynthesis protein) [Flavobacterium glaciei]
MKTKTEIIICGDLCPTADTQVLFDQADVKSLFNDVLPVLQKADFVMGNLEFVLTDDAKPIRKSGPVLYGKTSYIDVFKKAGFDLLSLANNHIKDCGEAGVKTTLATCESAGIAAFGAASNLQDAKKPYIKDINGWKIGFMTFAEQEFNVASNEEYGASYLDPYDDFDVLQELKKKVDYVVVIYHGGIEYYEYPSPLLQKKCQKFIDKGADLVTCQHSHCIGTIEDYKQKKIIYGQGNTLFGYRENNDSWNQGLLIRLLFVNEHAAPEISFVSIQAVQSGIELTKDMEAQKRLDTVATKSQNLTNKTFLEQSWSTFCLNKTAFYFAYLLGFNRLFIHLNRFSKNKLVSIFYPKKYIRTSQNIVRCEAHNEVLHTILNHHLKKQK